MKEKRDSQWLQGATRWTISLTGFVALLLVQGALFAAAPVIDGLTASSTTVPPGGTVTLAVNAHDPDCASTCTTGCGQYIRDDLTAWTATAGTFIPAAPPYGTSASPYTATVDWAAPLTEGLYTVTVSVSDSGTFMCGGRGTATQSLSVQVSNVINAAPVIDSFVATPSQLFVGETSALEAAAHDPDGDTLTWSWVATAGTIAAGVGGSATFQADADIPGIVTVTLTVTDDKGAPATRAVTLSVTSARADREFRAGLRAPQRVAADADGYLFVVDRTAGGILVFNGASGDAVASLPLPDATSIGVDGQGRLIVGTDTGAQIRDRKGALEGMLNPGMGLMRVQDVAVDPSTGRIGVLYANAQQVFVFNADSTVAFQFGQAGTGVGQSTGAASIACGPGGSWYLGDSGMGRVLVFDAQGAYLRSVGSKGGDPGEFNQLAGVAVDGVGVLWVTDAFQSRMTAFNADGTLREIVGTYGDGIGQLHTPLGIAALISYGKLAVTSANSGSLQLFAGSGATDPQPNRLPTVPTPINPAEGAVLPRGTALALEALNAVDPDYQVLSYQFELYDISKGTPALLQTWNMVEGAGSTAVDISGFAQSAGDYLWRVRATDGIGYSPWSPDFHFVVGVGRINRAPGIASPQGPAAGQESPDLVPFLVSQNTTDPDGDSLLYAYEVAVLTGGAYRPVTASPLVTEAATLTAWQVPPGALQPSQELYWRVQATDTFNAGLWSDFAFASFWTQPFNLPEAGEYGNIPGGDETRPGEIRYALGPQTADLTLYFQLYDISSPGELALEVNGNATHAIPSQVAGAWSLTVSVTVPVSELNASGENRFRFVHAGLNDPWGIRNLSLVAPPIPQLKATAFNTVVDLAWAPRPGLAAGTVTRLYRSYSATGPYAVIGEFDPSKALVRDTGLMNDETYFYRACFVNAEGQEGEPSAVVSARPSGLLGPTPITDLRVVRDGDDLVLTWTPVTTMPGLKQNEIYRGPTGAWIPDTSGFTNLWSIEQPSAGWLRIVGGVAEAGDAWVSVIPTDVLDRRAIP